MHHQITMFVLKSSAAAIAAAARTLSSYPPTPPTHCTIVRATLTKIDDKSVAGGGRAGKGDESLPPPRLSVAELFDEDRLEVMSCKYADYDPASLLTAGGDWLEERPNPSLSPKAVRSYFLIFF